jgi:hypothetical protein
MAGSAPASGRSPSCGLTYRRNYSHPRRAVLCHAQDGGGFSVYHGVSDLGSAAGEFFPGATTSIDSTKEVSRDRPSRPSCVV